MVEPAMWLDADVLLYQLDSDLSPNQKHLEKLLSNPTKIVRALLLPHYF